MSAALKYDPNDDLSIGALTVYGEASVLVGPHGQGSLPEAVAVFLLEQERPQLQEARGAEAGSPAPGRDQGRRSSGV
jgi:hypothetical protein